jgi:uncharacterized membrane protein YdbT with pleckstrin-like domain
MKVPHLVVSAFYAITQLIINIITIAMLEKGVMNRPRFVTIIVVLTIIYLIIRFWVVKKITSVKKMGNGVINTNQ